MTKATKPPAAKASAATSLPSESFKYRFAPEDADVRIAELIPANFANELSDGAWKVRLAALEEPFPHWLEGSLDAVDAELAFRFLGKKPGWNEKNFQVSSILTLT
jgi:cytoskeleton-associated protein 5